MEFLPRRHVENMNGEQWRTFHPFASYDGAHTHTPDADADADAVADAAAHTHTVTEASQGTKRGNSLRKVDAEATQDFVLPHTHTLKCWG